MGEQAPVLVPLPAHSRPATTACTHAACSEHGPAATLQATPWSHLALQRASVGLGDNAAHGGWDEDVAGHGQDAVLGDGGAAGEGSQAAEGLGEGGRGGGGPGAVELLFFREGIGA